MDNGYKILAAYETIDAQDKELARLKLQLKVENEDNKQLTAEIERLQEDLETRRAVNNMLIQSRNKRDAEIERLRAMLLTPEQAHRILHTDQAIHLKVSEKLNAQAAEKGNENG